MPKLICVCVAFGALVTGLVVWVSEPLPRAGGLVELEHCIFRDIMVPAVIGAVFFGVLLFLSGTGLAPFIYTLF